MVLLVVVVDMATAQVFIPPLKSLYLPWSSNAPLTASQIWIPPAERIYLPWITNAPFTAVCYGGSALLSAFHPSPLRTALSIAFIAWFTYLIFITHMDIPFWHAAGLLTAWPQNLIEYVERFLVGRQEDEPWQQVKGRPRAEVAKRRVPQTFWARLKWGIEISINPRGFGWSQEEKNIPGAPPAGTTRSAYLLRKVSQMAWLFFLKLQMNIVAAHLVADGRYLDDGLRAPIVSTFYSLPLWQRVLAVWFQALNCYWLCSVVGSLITVAGVVVGYWEPDDCPPINGPLSELYSVRKVWGTVWHQSMRRSASFVGVSLAHDILGFPKGSFGSRYTQLFAGFVTTGAIHAFATFVSLGHSIGEWTFYPGQAVAIFVEDHVIKAGKALGFRDNKFWRVVGALWVFVWFSFALQGLGGGLITNGSLLYDKPIFDPFGLDPWLRQHRSEIF